MFCSKCGKELPDGANFCVHCGNGSAPTNVNGTEFTTKCPHCGTAISFAKREQADKAHCPECKERIFGGRGGSLDNLRKLAWDRSRSTDCFLGELGKCYGKIILALIGFVCLIYPGLILMCGIQREMLYGDSQFIRPFKNGIARWRNLLGLTLLMFAEGLLIYAYPQLLITIPLLLPLTMLFLTGIALATPETDFFAILSKAVHAFFHNLWRSSFGTMIFVAALIPFGLGCLFAMAIAERGIGKNMGARRYFLPMIFFVCSLRLWSFFHCFFAYLYCETMDIYPRQLLAEQDS